MLSDTPPLPSSETATTMTTTATASPSSVLDLNTCTPQELALHLQALPRFNNNSSNSNDNSNNKEDLDGVNNNENRCQCFLQQALEALAKDKADQDDKDDTKQSSVTPSPSPPKKDDPKEVGNATTVESLGPALTLEDDNLLSLEHLTCQVPRCGKVALALHEQGIVARKKAAKNSEHGNEVCWMLQSQTLDDGEAVQRIVVFAKPDDVKQKKKRPQHLILLQSTTDRTLVTFKDKPYTQVCLVVPPPPSNKKKDVQEERSKEQLEHDARRQQESQLQSLVSHIARAVGTPPVTWIPSSPLSSHKPAFSSFCDPATSTTSANLPFVSAYLGVKDGVLYPLREGLLFGGPPWTFLPRQQLVSIQAGRGGGNSRYVDVQVTKTVVSIGDNDSDADGEQEQVEFTNIDRTELTGLNSYIHKVLIPAMRRDVVMATGAEQRDEGETKKDDNEEEEAVAVAANESTDDDPVAVQVKEEEGPSSGRKRRASQEARQAIRQKQRRVNSGGSEDDSFEDEDPDFEEQEDEESDSDDEDAVHDDEGSAGDNFETEDEE